MTKRFGFTLAEVLITLGIIGIVAAMTIPTLVADYQERSFNTAATTFERKLGEALKVMNSQMTLAGHTSTESFVNELKKHIKVTKTCDNDKLIDCFENEVSWGGGDVEAKIINLDTIKSSKNFGQKNWEETNVIGVQFANGVSALIAYNKDAKQDPYSNQIVNISGGIEGKKGSVSLGTDALAILYDTNGYKSPNESGKDLRSINISRLGNACAFEIEGSCYGVATVPTPHIWNSCNSDGTSTNSEDLSYMAKYGIKYCLPPSIGQDYWAGAVEMCNGVDNLTSMQDLSKIANIIYNTNRITDNWTVSDLTRDDEKAAELGITFDIGTCFWSNSEVSATSTRRRCFSSSMCDGNQNYKRVDTLRAICKY